MSNATAILIDPPTDDRLFVRYAGAFLSSFTAETTRRAYRFDLHDWAGWCAHWQIPPLEARRPHVDLFMQHLEDRGLAPATRARRLTTLRSFYTYLVREDLSERNPAAVVTTPKVDHEDRPYLDRVQIRLLQDAAEAAYGYRWPLVQLLFVCGLRISEATRADVGDLGVHRHHRTLTIEGKGSKTAVVPLPPEVIMAVDRHLEERDHPESGPLLVSDRGNRLVRTTAAHQLRRLCWRAGVPEVSPHALRRSVITILLLSGVPLRDVQLFARHENPSTTARYDAAARTLDAHASYSVARAMT